MHSKILNVAILAMLAAGASAATHRVEVGQRGGFAPDTITADEGDIVEFHFNAMHTVVAGDFKNPCTPVASGGFYSGTMPVGDKVSQAIALVTREIQSWSFFLITINNTEPIFFYCSVDAHCQGGMVGVINQGSDTLKAFSIAAEKSENSISPRAPFGGTLGSGSATTATSGTRSSIMSTSIMTGSRSMTATVVTSEFRTGSETAFASEQPTHSPTTSIQPGSAGHFISPIAGMSCLALFVGGMLVLE